ncbi:MAG: GIY-YIG nuclease family protein, partial [Bacteroidetes bacterium]|nr:GIY-YIG nuclease family protein [Bacteroidota bacterium]
RIHERPQTNNPDTHRDFFMPKYYVYILRSSGGRYYIGFTSNLTRRISQHNKKHKGFTGRSSETWELVTSRRTAFLALRTFLVKNENFWRKLRFGKKTLFGICY